MGSAKVTRTVPSRPSLVVLINFFSTPALSQPDRVDYLELVCVVTDVATLRRGVSWYAAIFAAHPRPDTDIS
jgi:hypothetical protein